MQHRSLGELRKPLARQAEEILRLRAMFMGLAEVVQTKTASAMSCSSKRSTRRGRSSARRSRRRRRAIYRGMSTDGAPVDVPEAEALLANLRTA